MNKIMRQAMGWLAVAALGLLPMALHAQTDSTVTGNLFVDETLSGGLSSSTNNFLFQTTGTLLDTGALNSSGNLSSGDQALSWITFFVVPS